MSRIAIGRAENGAYVVDLRGWMCPYPKYMLEPILAKVAVPCQLVFLVDCPSAVTDLPRLAQSRGGQTSDIKQIADGEWRVSLMFQ